MINSLEISNFTLFEHCVINFAKGLNVFVGTNSTGKSHLMKLIYASLRGARKHVKDSQASLTKTHLEKEIADRLLGVFQPETLGRLARRGVGRKHTEIKLTWDRDSLQYSFSTASKKVNLLQIPDNFWQKEMVFFPTREMLSIYPNFYSTYETTHIPFEETWKDLAIHLGKGISRGQISKDTSTLLEPLEDTIQGKLIQKNGRFYIRLDHSGALVEAHLLAEGHRKLASLAWLIANKTIKKGTCLFWDEPEANLNPELIQKIAKVIMTLVKGGVQIFMATHSLFLLRALYLEKNKDKKIKSSDCKYFGLQTNPNNGSIEIQSGETMDDIGAMNLLDSQIAQDEELMEFYV